MGVPTANNAGIALKNEGFDRNGRTVNTHELNGYPGGLLCAIVQLPTGEVSQWLSFLLALSEPLAAGALAKAGDVGGRGVTDAYDALRALIVRKLGKGGAVQSVEDEPRSEAAQAALAEALTTGGLGADPELARHAEALRAAVTGAPGTGGADIEVGDI